MTYMVFLKDLFLALCYLFFYINDMCYDYEHPHMANDVMDTFGHMDYIILYTIFGVTRRLFLIGGLFKFIV